MNRKLKIKKNKINSDVQQIVKWGEIVCVELKNKKNYNREKFFIKKK